MDPQCLLCRIVRGEVKPRLVVDTDRVLALMNDLEPLSRGHVVFFPRAHAARLDLLDDEDLAAVLAQVKRVARAMEIEDYNLLQNNGAIAGQTVFHAHFHLIPKWSDSEGLRYDRPQHGARADHDAIYAKLRARLG